MLGTSGHHTSDTFTHNFSFSYELPVGILNQYYHDNGEGTRTFVPISGEGIAVLIYPLSPNELNKNKTIPFRYDTNEKSFYNKLLGVGSSVNTKEIQIPLTVKEQLETVRVRITKIVCAQNDTYYVNIIQQQSEEKSEAINRLDFQGFDSQGERLYSLEPIRKGLGFLTELPPKGGKARRKRVSNKRKRLSNKRRRVSRRRRKRRSKGSKGLSKAQA